MRRLLTLAATALLAALPLQAASGQGLVVGYNQAWIHGAWERDLTSRFDPAAWQRVLQRTRAAGGRVLRVWLFEGLTKEGVVWDGTRPIGVDPGFLRNLGTLIDLARAEGVSLYWTALDGNWPAHWPRGGIEHFRHYNVLANKYGEGDLFRRDVLGPVLDVIEAAADVTWGLDLMNEVQGSVKTWMWSDGWAGARRFVATTARFVHARAPGLRITASSGHHTSGDDVLAGRFDGLGLDFYDVHVYTDTTTVPRGRALVEHAWRRGRTVVLGEVGQRSERVDPGLQAHVLEGLLGDAARLGFEAVLAWRLEDWQDGGRRFTFYEQDGTPRPAVRVMRRYGR